MITSMIKRALGHCRSRFRERRVAGVPCQPQFINRQQPGQMVSFHHLRVAPDARRVTLSRDEDFSMMFSIGPAGVLLRVAGSRLACIAVLSLAVIGGAAAQGGPPQVTVATPL